MMGIIPQGIDDRFVAAVDMINRAGALACQIRYSDDEKPVVWFAVAEFGQDGWDVDAAGDPLTAMLRLCERVIDGSTCIHCGKITALDVNFGNSFLDTQLCWYSYDPELRTFRRGCE